MRSQMELVRPLEHAPKHSPLAAARLQRKLTVEQAARRAGLAPDQIEWLEEGRVYRFPSPDNALLALSLYVTGLGVDHREARALAGLRVAPAARKHVGPLVGAATIAAVVAAVLLTVWPGLHFGGSHSKTPSAWANLPAPWRIEVDVLNGSGDRNYTGRVASHIGALGYRIEHVGRANRFDYPETAVYYERGGERVAARLGSQLAVGAKPLPGGRNPRRLVVIVGPQRGPG
jgi:LytR cell envelope-related transcriptional attenuator/Helix-turn-helix domain